MCTYAGSYYREYSYDRVLELLLYGPINSACNSWVAKKMSASAQSVGPSPGSHQGLPRRHTRPRPRNGPSKPGRDGISAGFETETARKPRPTGGKLENIVPTSERKRSNPETGSTGKPRERKVNRENQKQTVNHETVFHTTETSRKPRVNRIKGVNNPSITNNDVSSTPTDNQNTRRAPKRTQARGPQPTQEAVTRDSLVCPICCEKFEELELRFYPCPCSYRVCTMCVHLIKEKADGKCPNCRETYEEGRQRLEEEVDKGIARILRQVTEEEAREARQAKQKPQKRIFQSPPKPWLNRSHIELCEKEINRILAAHQTSQSTKESSPVSTPAPEIKLTRFSGGLSVWD